MDPINQNGQPSFFTDDESMSERKLPPELWHHIFVLAFGIVAGDEISEERCFVAANTTSRYLRHVTYDARKKMLLSMKATSPDQASRKGQIDLLEWWLHDSGIDLQRFSTHYTSKAIGYAAENGHLDVLRWWRSVAFRHGLPFKYDKYAIDKANERGNRAVLQWWKDHHMPFVYTKCPLDVALSHKRWDVVDWWMNVSGQPMFFKSPPFMLEHVMRTYSKRVPKLAFNGGFP